MSDSKGTPVPPITRTLHRHIEARIAWEGLDRARVKRWVQAQWGVEHFPDLTHEQANSLLARLPEWADQLELAAEREAIRREGCGLPMTD